MSVLTAQLQALTRSPGNPFFGYTPWPAWESSEHQECTVVKEGSTYYLFYAGGNGSHVELGVMSTSVSNYPSGWSRLNGGNPVLTFGGQPGIDDVNVSSPYVVKMQDGSWRFYYQAWPGVAQRSVGCVAMCAAANFPVGPWTKYASNPVLPIGTSGTWCGDGIRLIDPMPPWVSGDSVWHCMVAGYNANGHATGVGVWQAGHATSPDGLAWTVDASPCLPPQGVWGTGWEAGWTYPFILCKDGSQYVVVYSGTNASYGTGSYWTPGFATASSPAGPWTRHPDPILSAGSPGAWDENGASFTSLVSRSDGTLDAWYLASGVNIDYGFNIGIANAPVVDTGADVTERATLATTQSGIVADAPSAGVAASLAASQDAAYGAANRLTVAAGPVVGGVVTLSGSRVPGSVVYVSR